ncbi:uncharacterized protein LOC131434377 [Malaya genurostris]|uniref:uncharacterized protein LOC131434377 n=1 Tax=Malaya genurostris TaxID=325434 RepID=UPI0026F3A2BD|nr:uncharacterized protein LOC131434377 [Malaya genurostris]
MMGSNLFAADVFTFRFPLLLSTFGPILCTPDVRGISYEQEYLSSAELEPYVDYRSGGPSSTAISESEVGIFGDTRHRNVTRSYPYNRSAGQPSQFSRNRRRYPYPLTKLKKRSDYISDSQKVFIMDSHFTNFVSSIASSLKVMVLMLAFIVPAIIIHFFVIPIKIMVAMAKVSLLNLSTLGLVWWGFFGYRRYNYNSWLNGGWNNGWWPNGWWPNGGVNNPGFPGGPGTNP